MITNSLGAAHLTSAFAALLLGFIVLVAAKGTHSHRLFGAAYVTAMVIVNLTALGVFRLTGQFNAFHGLALLSLATTAWGLFVAVRRRKGWMASHLYFMSYSYLGLMAAAASEAILRVGPLRSMVNGRTGVVAAGVAIAVVFALIGVLVVPRLGRAAMAGAADR